MPQPLTSSDHPPPTSVYVHVPFCRHRCGYCNFPLVADRDYLIDSYLQALPREIDFVLQRHPWREPLQTLFLGGGTPSHLGPTQLARLLQSIFDRCPLQPDAELTVEVNPNDVTLQLVKTLAQGGINRISLGAQSFDDDKLRRLDRQHTSGENWRAIEQCREFIPHLSLDLMFAVGESRDVWQRDIDLAIRAGVDHISTYELTIEKGTEFWSRAQRQPEWRVDEDTRAEMYQIARDRLLEAGWEHYEISNYARPGCRSRHNQAYWNGSRYLAFGPGAASFVGNQRWVNHASPAYYVRQVTRGQSPSITCETSSPRQLAAELLAFGIRLLDGVDLRMVEAQTGCRLADLWSPENSNCRDFVLIASDRLRLSPAGVLFADSVGSELLQCHQAGN